MYHRLQSDLDLRATLWRCYALARERARLVREKQQAQRDGLLLAGKPSRQASAPQPQEGEGKGDCTA